MPKLSAVLAVVMLTGCGSSPSTTATPKAPASTPQVAAAPAPPPVTARERFPTLDAAIYEAKIARTGQTNAPTIDPLPEYKMGIAPCDDLLLRLTSCKTLPNKPKVFARAMWDVMKDQLDQGGDRGEIDRQCTQESELESATANRASRLLTPR